MQLYALSAHIMIRTVSTYCNAAIRTVSTSTLHTDSVNELVGIKREQLRTVND